VLVMGRIGPGGLKSWHEPVGAMLPAACFLGIWIAGVCLQRPDEVPPARDSNGAGGREFGGCVGPGSSFCLALILSCWLLAVEVGVEGWYRIHERQLAVPTCWRVELPVGGAGFRALPLPAAAKQMLRFSEGLNATWPEDNGLRWQAIFLRWDPGSTAVRLARNHTPEDCLVASGRPLLAEPGFCEVRAGGLRLPFRRYLVRDEHGPVQVFYCLWEDRASGRSPAPEWLTYRHRLEPVLAGQRHSGQRSLELILWGAPEPEAALSALEALLSRIIVVES
jgi:hypothetical protein